MYLDCVLELEKLQEELGDFSLLEDEDLDDGAEGREPGEHDLVGHLDYHRVVDADQQHLRRRFFGLGLSFLHKFELIIIA